MFDDRKSFDTVVKLRYRNPGVACHVEIKNAVAKITLKEPVLGVAAGQAAVFYDEDKLIGGGWITSTV
jgi:tRNA-specific 2-thiouridylase